MNDLGDARLLLDELTDEWLRLLGEAHALGVLSTLTWPLSSVAGLDERAQSVVGFLDAVERFARDVFPRVEEKAEQGDVDAAFRLKRGTANILAAVRGTSPVDDTLDDATTFVRDVTRQVAGASAALLVIGVAAFAVTLALK